MPTNIIHETTTVKAKGNPMQGKDTSALVYILFSKRQPEFIQTSVSDMTTKG